MVRLADSELASELEHWYRQFILTLSLRLGVRVGRPDYESERRSWAAGAAGPGPGPGLRVAGPARGSLPVRGAAAGQESRRRLGLLVVLHSRPGT